MNNRQVTVYTRVGKMTSRARSDPAMSMRGDNMAALELRLLAPCVATLAWGGELDPECTSDDACARLFDAR